MSTENPVLRPFTGLGPFEALVDRVRLRATDSSLVPVLLEPGIPYRASSSEIHALGVALQFDWTEDELVAAATSARVPLDMVHLYVVAEDSFLKERQVLEPVLAASEVTASFPIASRGQARTEALANRFNGFELVVALVLAEQMDEIVAFRPHRKGTVLATTRFTIRPERNTAGLDPKPLDEQARKANPELPASTLLFVDIDGQLLEHEDIGQCVTIYVHEKLYAAMQGPGPERTAVAQQLAIDAWGHIIHALHDEVDDSYVWKEGGSAVLRLLLQLVRTQKKKTTPEQLLGLIRGDPRLLCAIVSGAGNQAGQLLKVLGDDETKDDDE